MFAYLLQSKGTKAEVTPFKYCALSQTQLQKQTRQRALVIELHPEEGGVQGNLLLPLGLSLPSGVTYGLDDDETGPVQPFRTCLPTGYLVEIAFDARTVETLKTGSAMKVEAVADGGEPFWFSISLGGFTSGYDRVRALTE